LNATQHDIQRELTCVEYTEHELTHFGGYFREFEVGMSKIEWEKNSFHETCV